MADWNTAVPDWEDRLLAGRSLVPDLPLFQEEADKALRIFKRFKVPDLIGTPPMAEVAGEWILSLLAALFGSYDVASNMRMIQEFFLLVPKKNGKSSYAAAIMLVAIIMNRRPLAEYLLIAPTKTIADIAFKQIAGTIRADDELAKLFLIQEHIRKITHRLTSATVEVKAADTDVITGGKSTGILIDETHVFAAMSKAAAIFVEVRGALAARKDGFMLQITTQSKTPPAGVFKSELANARAARDGRLKLERPILAVLYELPKRLGKDAWKDERYWPLVNPNLGRSVNIAYLRDELTKAEQATDKMPQLVLLASQHFNVEIGLGLQTDRWSGADHWERQVDKTLTLDELLSRSEVVTIGIDGGGNDDLLSLGVIGRENGTRRWLQWQKSWLQRAAMDLRKSENPAFLDFEQAGELVIVDGTDDITQLADEVVYIRDSGLLPEKNAIGLDPVGIGQIIDELALRGITNEEGGMIAGISQGWKLSGAVETVARKLKDGSFQHGGQAIMAYAVGNAKIEPKGNAVTITKQVSGRAKIDPLMATLDAAALMSLNPAASASVYNERVANPNEPVLFSV